MLGGYSRASVDQDVVTLLNSIRNGFHSVVLATGGQEVGTYSTPWGATAHIVLADGASIFTWSDTPVTATMETSTPSTYDDGEIVGTVTWTAGPNTATADLEIEGTIVPPTEWWRLTHPSELG
jgi:D-alanyl-D-alanine carboxypeptidase (penicillin-binding protein 5/6)